MSPPPGEGWGWRKRPILGDIPGVDCPLSLFLVFGPFLMWPQLTLFLIPEYFRAKIINLVFGILCLNGALWVWMAGCWVFCIRYVPKGWNVLSSKPEPDLCILSHLLERLQVFGHGLGLSNTDEWRNVKTPLRFPLALIILTTSKMPFLTCFYFQETLWYANVFNN